MAKRYVGDAVVKINYVGTSSDGREEYEGTITANGKTWEFDKLGSGVGGFRFASDSPQAFDKMASSAVSFASYYAHGNRGDDVPEWAPPEDVADAIADATMWASKDDGEYEVRRSKDGPARESSAREAPANENLVPFRSWPELMTFARAGGVLFYKAPMDHHAVRLRPGRGEEATYEVRAKTLRIWPYGSVGRGRRRTADPFTADAGHLDRFFLSPDVSGGKTYERHRVADFNTLDDLIAHAGRDGATHVSGDGARTQIFYPRGGQYPYESATVWRKEGFWHAQGPHARTGIARLPSGSRPIGGHRRAAEARREIEHELWLCEDCTIAEVNGDYSGMSEERAEEVSAGIERLVGEVGPLHANWDSESGEGIIEFSRRTCDACRTNLAGGRHRFATFGTSMHARAPRARAREDYIAVDRSDRRIAGPFPNRHQADPHVPPGGHVKFVPRYRGRRGAPTPPSSYPIFRARANEASRKQWKQVGGDVNPRDYGAVLAKVDGDYVNIVEIDTGEEEGDAFRVQRADIHVSDLDWANNQDVAGSHGISHDDWEQMSLEHRAEAKLRHWGAYHLGGDVFETNKWSQALPARSNQIAWWR